MHSHANCSNYYSYNAHNSPTGQQLTCQPKRKLQIADVRRSCSLGSWKLSELCCCCAMRARSLQRNQQRERKGKEIKNMGNGSASEEEFDLERSKLKRAKSMSVKNLSLFVCFFNFFFRNRKSNRDPIPYD